MAYYVYILTTSRHGVFYTGLTNNLVRRIYEHKNKLVDGFTKKYRIDKLVYFEQYKDVRIAIEREKQIKDYRREKKKALINSMNTTWKDLYFEISQG